MWPQRGTNVTPMLPLWDPTLPPSGGSIHLSASTRQKSNIQQKHEKLESPMQWECLRPSVAPMWSKNVFGLIFETSI